MNLVIVKYKNSLKYITGNYELSLQVKTSLVLKGSMNARTSQVPVMSFLFPT
jgi:hypothetical protein